MIRDRKKKSVNRFFNLNPHIRWALLVLIVVVFTTGLYPSLVIKKHRYDIGDVVKTDIKATEDFIIEDLAATEALRRQAVDNVVPVYDLNPKILKGTVTRLNDAFEQLRLIYVQETKKLKTESQTSAGLTGRCTGPSAGTACRANAGPKKSVGKSNRYRNQ